MIISIFILIIFVLILLIAVRVINNDVIKIIICILSTVGLILGIHNADSNSDIPAIEVYRGNTTLQITYEGDTPIDSTVVLKYK